MEAASAAPAADKRRHPFPWLNLMATEPFYLLHFLLFFSYFGARTSASQTLSADLAHRLFRRVPSLVLDRFRFNFLPGSLHVLLFVGMDLVSSSRSCDLIAVIFFVLLGFGSAGDSGDSCVLGAGGRKATEPYQWMLQQMVKEETWEAFVVNTLLYAKGFLFAITLVIDYHLALCYLLGFLVIFIITQQPPHDGLVFYFLLFVCLGDCSQLTPLQLESLLTEGSTSRFWLVSS
ncbi:hypothetical protein BHE74_00001496 [Ensete ventricosum]|nr:hypothetical protein BHE74_00001496 [Ensete ventricosum]